MIKCLVLFDVFFFFPFFLSRLNILRLSQVVRAVLPKSLARLLVETWA